MSMMPIASTSARATRTRARAPRTTQTRAPRMKMRQTTRATTRTRAIANEARTSEELNFWGKMRQAYRIFFPPSAEENARNEAKKRLRMILVADRCTMSESSMDEMKAKIMTVVGEFVDVDDSQEVDVSMNTDEELGTMYAVSIPVKRVKAEYDAENDAYMLGAQLCTTTRTCGTTND